MTDFGMEGKFEWTAQQHGWLNFKLKNELVHGSSWTWKWTELKNTKTNLDGKMTFPPWDIHQVYLLLKTLHLAAGTTREMSEKENECGWKSNKLSNKHDRSYIVYTNQAHPPPPPLLPPLLRPVLHIVLEDCSFIYHMQGTELASAIITLLGEKQVHMDGQCIYCLSGATTCIIYAPSNHDTHLCGKLKEHCTRIFDVI